VFSFEALAISESQGDRMRRIRKKPEWNFAWNENDLVNAMEEASYVYNGIISLQRRKKERTRSSKIVTETDRQWEADTLGALKQKFQKFTASLTKEQVRWIKADARFEYDEHGDRWDRWE
jgi:hypothetical protein